MKASIVIPNLNGAGWLRDSIESIWAQTEQDFELIIIDNGSTDESLAIARSYVGRPGYTLVENQTNTGFSAAVNTGIGLAKGEYVVLFPEGTRVSAREEGEPKTGAAMLACRTGVNVLPVYIPMKKRPFRINRVYIGTPYRMQRADGKRATSKDYETFTTELMDKIYDLGDGR